MLLFNNSTETVSDVFQLAAYKLMDPGAEVFNAAYLRPFYKEAWSDLAENLILHGVEAIKKTIVITLTGSVTPQPASTTLGPTGSGADQIEPQLDDVVEVEHPLLIQVQGVNTEMNKVDNIDNNLSEASYTFRGDVFTFRSFVQPRTIVMNVTKDLAIPPTDGKLGIKSAYKFLANKIAALAGKGNGNLTKTLKEYDLEAAESLSNIITIAVRGEGVTESSQFTATRMDMIPGLGIGVVFRN